MRQRQTHGDGESAGSISPRAGYSSIALLLVDAVNDLEFPGGEKLLQHALPMAEALRAFKSRAKPTCIPAIYANDNFGRWRSDFPKLVQYCLGQSIRGKPLGQQLSPEPDDYFILKPKHSRFTRPIWILC